MCQSEKRTGILNPWDFQALFLSMYAMVIKTTNICAVLYSWMALEIEKEEEVLKITIFFPCAIRCICGYYNLGEVIPSIGEKMLGRMISLCIGLPCVFRADCWNANKTFFIDPFYHLIILHQCSMPLLYASMLDYPISDDVHISSTVMATTNSLLFFRRWLFTSETFSLRFWFVGLNT
jgi:hypothetical protein